jgi:PAS domain S-box-containing protein
MLDEVPFASRRAMETVAAQVGNAVARIQVQESLRESEGRYRALFDSASDAIFIHDMGDRFLEVNKVACERLEYSRDELLQMTPADINSPKSPDLVRERAEEVRRSGHGFFEIAHVRRDGTVFPAELSSRIIEYKGKPAVLSIARDITRRKQAEDALRASEMKYRTLFEKIPHGIYQITLEGKMLAANPALVQLLGYDSETELLAVDVENDLYVNPIERRRWMKELEIRREIRDAELVFKRKDGSELTVLDNAHLVCDDQGTLLYNEGTLTDITERKQMEKELALYSEHLQELVKERTKKLAESEERFRDLADLCYHMTCCTLNKARSPGVLT